MPQRPWVQYFAALLRPSVWELFHHVMVSFPFTQKPLMQKSHNLGNFLDTNFFRLSIKSSILAHASITKFSLGSELSCLGYLLCYNVVILCLIVYLYNKHSTPAHSYISMVFIQVHFLYKYDKFFVCTSLQITSSKV